MHDNIFIIYVKYMIMKPNKFKLIFAFGTAKNLLISLTFEFFHMVIMAVPLLVVMALLY